MVSTKEQELHNEVMKKDPKRVLANILAEDTFKGVEKTEKWDVAKQMCDALNKIDEEGFEIGYSDLNDTTKRDFVGTVYVKKYTGFGKMYGREQFDNFVSLFKYCDSVDFNPVAYTVGKDTCAIEFIIEDVWRE